MVRKILAGHCLEGVPLKYLVIVEGTTDIYYFIAAAKKANEDFGVDLLDLDGDGRIEIVTPIDPSSGERKRGGIPQLVRLAKDIVQFVIRFEVMGPICFLLDHDPEGEKTRDILKGKEMGYGGDRAAVLTLDHREHPGACRQRMKGSDPIVVEDLIGIKLQKEFFSKIRPTCEVSHIDGQVTRISWREPSKYELCTYVCENGTCRDLRELIRVLIRIRKMWNLDVPQSINDLLHE